MDLVGGRFSGSHVHTEEPKTNPLVSVSQNRALDAIVIRKRIEGSRKSLYFRLLGVFFKS